MKLKTKPGRPSLPAARRKSQSVLVKVDLKTRQAFTELAEMRGTSTSGLARQLMLDALQHV